MITFIAYLILQANILTGTSTLSKPSTTSTSSQCVTQNGGWVDKD